MQSCIQKIKKIYYGILIWGIDDGFSDDTGGGQWVAAALICMVGTISYVNLQYG